MRAAEVCCWLGAPAQGGLILPSAQATATQCYAPRGVYLDQECLVVADSGNHRILRWQPLPVQDQAPAQQVLGQPDLYSEGPKQLHLPTGILLAHGRLYVCDAWHHRVLFWEGWPQQEDTPPSGVLGQPDLLQVEPNQGKTISRHGLNWPYGIGVVGDWLLVTDTGNRRVVVWNGRPESGQPPDNQFGQPDWESGEENRGTGVGPNTFRWPHAIAGDQRGLLVADAGNHRVLGWTEVTAAWAGKPADLLLGQEDFHQAREVPYQPPGAQRLRFPYGIALSGDILAISDTGNHRVLLFDWPDVLDGRRAARGVIGQADLQGSGENRWESVRADTLCWPYGLSLRGNQLAIADSGNNRVMLWQLNT